MRYARKTGSLNLGIRIEHGFAMLATLLNNVHGGKATFDDFLPSRDLKPDPKQATPQDLLALLQSVKR
jgi:hypothetical protein